jgi:multidrug resistance efflux pump
MTNNTEITQTDTVNNIATGQLLPIGEVGRSLSDSEKIELLSDDVQEIMGHVPPWLIRWGITVLFFILVGVIAGSFVFKYPDVITSSMVIISENPPVSIVAHTNGKIDYLFAWNAKQVKPGEILAILENTANYSHVIELKNKLGQFSALSTNGSVPAFTGLPEQYILGTIQGSYSNFQKQYQEYYNYSTLNLLDKKINSIQQQLFDYAAYLERLQAQARNQDITMQLTYRQFMRDSSLYAGSVIAASDFEKSEQSYLQVKNTYQSLMASLANTQMQINQLKYQVIDYQSQKEDQTRRLFNAMKESYDNLKAAIADWEKVYMLTSPIEGNVTFTKYWSKNQYVTSGDIVFTVVPGKTQRIMGRASIQTAGSGKVKVGQIVHIQLDNFPYTEFGMIEGKIESISLIAESNQKGTFYTAEVSLPKGLTTNYRKTLPFNQEMQGTAQIITENMTLFEQLINPIRAALKK